MPFRWKFIIVSIVLYQCFLTWLLFDLVDTASYFARNECDYEWCGERLFGYILTNQGAYDSAWTWMWITIALFAANIFVWFFVKDAQEQVTDERAQKDDA